MQFSAILWLSPGSAASRRCWFGWSRAPVVGARLQLLQGTCWRSLPPGGKNENENPQQSAKVHGTEKHNEQQPSTDSCQTLPFFGNSHGRVREWSTMMNTGHNMSTSLENYQLQKRNQWKDSHEPREPTQMSFLPFFLQIAHDFCVGNVSSFFLNARATVVTQRIHACFCQDIVMFSELILQLDSSQQ